jgi:hypothetical protein
MTKANAARVTASQLAEECERLIQKKRYKDAVKQAKLCCKENKSPENQARLERAYYLRAKELYDAGMRDSARDVVGHLLELGVNASDWFVDLCQLLIALGLASKAAELQDRLGTAEDKARLMEAAADLAVVHPEVAGSASPEVKREADLVRHAIEKLEQGDEAAASSLLRDLARSSILSEWKYFAKGLAAFHRHDKEAQEANWARLDARRAAARIADRLRGLAALEQSEVDGPAGQRLEKLVFGEPLIGQIRKIATLVAKQEWTEVSGLLGPLREKLRRIDAKLPERLTRAMVGSLIHQATELYPEDAERLINRFAKAAEPLAIDPNWNRLRGIVWDASGDTGEQARRCWSRYIEDLTSIPAFTAQERQLAQAIVLNHTAESFQREIDSAEDEDDLFPPWNSPRAQTAATTKAIEHAKKSAVACLEQSLRLAPDYLPTYQALVDFYDTIEDANRLEAAALRLLAKFPDDLETLTLLAEHYLSRDEPAAALPWAQKARKLKPLDESLRENEWVIRVNLARTNALAKRLEEGRAEFAAADQLFPDRMRDYSHLARKAVFEAKARQPDRSAALIGEAQRQIVEPGPLWLALLIQSIRYKADQKSRAEYARLWTAELKKPVKSETAGEMARLLNSVFAMGTEYPELDSQVKKVVAYLRRTLKLNYRLSDLVAVCDFLVRASGPLPLLKNLVHRGLSTYPASARLQFEAGLIEFKMGPLGGSLVAARRHLQKAVQLAGASSDQADLKFLPQIKELLSQLNDLAEGPLGPLFFGNFPFEPPAPRRQSRPRGRSRTQEESRSRESFQMSFPLFFDDDDLDPETDLF